MDERALEALSIDRAGAGRADDEASQERKIRRRALEGLGRIGYGVPDVVLRVCIVLMCYCDAPCKLLQLRMALCCVLSCDWWLSFCGAGNALF